MLQIFLIYPIVLALYFGISLSIFLNVLPQFRRTLFIDIAITLTITYHFIHIWRTLSAHCP